jgi:hypothetical protein
MRSCILAHSSWNGGGVSWTRGSANPVAVFIAEAVLDSTSMRTSARTRGCLSTTGRLGNYFRASCTPAPAPDSGPVVKEPRAYRYRHLGRSHYGKARTAPQLSTQRPYSKPSQNTATDSTMERISGYSTKRQPRLEQQPMRSRQGAYDALTSMTFLCAATGLLELPDPEIALASITQFRAGVVTSL